MARRRKKQKRTIRSPKGTSDKRASGGKAPTSPVPVGERRRIESLVQAGKHREALTRAKGLYSRLGTSASEELLADVYVARVVGLLEGGMRHEARALLRTVWDRYPGVRERLEPLRVVAGMLEELLSPLGKPDLTDAQREEIQTRVREQVWDLDELAGCQTLPEDHRLRRDARALYEALALVTSGEVEQDEVALGQISRRSPLAPWKMLIRALACFYGRQDARARRWLDAIDPTAAVRPLADVLGCLIDGGTPPWSDALPLADAVAGSSADLRRRLERVEDALGGEGSPKATLQAVKEAIQTCERVRPELTIRLRQHMSVRAVFLGLRAPAVLRALGDASRKDAYFWRLWARAQERRHGGPSVSLACALWDRFLCHAVAEGWFPVGGAEEAAVLGHMAELLARLSSDELEVVRREGQPDRFAATYNEQPAQIREVGLAGNDMPKLYFLAPAYLYERVCAVSPKAEHFRAWLQWSRHVGSAQKVLDRVATRWHEALPTDSRPLLLLYESAERRRAFTKALGFLREAEAVDGLNPEIQRVRARLLVATAVRHLCGRKPHLLINDIAAMEDELAGRVDLSALVPAFRCVWRMLRKEPERAREEVLGTEDLLGSRQTCLVVLRAVFEAGQLPETSFKTVTGGMGRFGIGRTPDTISALILLRDAGLSVTLPTGWYRGMGADLRLGRCTLTADQLRALAESALDGEQWDLAYLASGAGLRLPEADVARFLLLRARSLPSFALGRREDCLEAVVELARQRQDVALLEEAGRVQRSRPIWMDDLRTAVATEEDVRWSEVLSFERMKRKYPKFEAPAPYWEDEDDVCDCAACRRRRGEGGSGIGAEAEGGRRGRSGRRPSPIPQLDLGWLDDDELEELDGLNDDDFDDDALDELDDDEQANDELAKLNELGLEPVIGALLGRIPPGVESNGLSLIAELVSRFGGLPSPEVLEAEDPELFEQMMKLVGEFGTGVESKIGKPKGGKPRGGTKGRRR